MGFIGYVFLRFFLILLRFLWFHIGLLWFYNSVWQTAASVSLSKLGRHLLTGRRAYFANSSLCQIDRKAGVLIWHIPGVIVANVFRKRIAQTRNEFSVELSLLQSSTVRSRDAEVKNKNWTHLRLDFANASYFFFAIIR